MSFIRKIAHLEENPLKIAVNSANNRRDPISRHVLLRRPSVWILPLPVPYRVGSPTNVFPLLKLWHLHWLRRRPAVSSAVDVAFHVWGRHCCCHRNTSVLGQHQNDIGLSALESPRIKNMSSYSSCVYSRTI